jgi:F-type H+-transporting ATPase subunit delta
MSGSAVAQNYAEALFELATRSGQLEQYGRLIEAAAVALESSPEAQSILVSPKVSKALKSDLIGKAVSKAGAPPEFVRYLQAVVKRGRQMMFGAIATSYHELVDRKLNRVRASVIVARQPDQALEKAIAASLARVLEKEVVTRFSVDPEILGGTIVRVGDRIYDGSVRRRLVRLKRQLIGR